MPALASTELVFKNNLSGDEMPGSSAVSSLTVYDSLGNAHDLGQAFTKVGENTWLAKASLADSTLTLGGSTLTQIEFETSGKLKEVKTVNPTSIVENSITLANLQLDDTAGSAHDQYFTVFDSTSTPHVIKLAYERAETSGTWNYSLTEAGASNSTPLLSGVVTYSAGAYTFPTPTPPATNLEFSIGTEKYNFITSAVNPLAPVAAGTFVSTSVPTFNANISTVSPITFTAPGAALSSIELDVSALTQYGGASTVQAATQDGYAAGSLDSPTIDTSGIIVGKFSNGRTQNLGQVALATFNNPGGLTRVGDTLFSTSNNSGNPSVGTSGTGGRGTLTPGSLEMSNIDLAEQFSKMIITQRGFQANSKIITTSDTMLEELVNLKR